VTWHLIFCLRLSAVLHRSRDESALPDIRLGYGAGGYRLEVPGSWLVAHPLSAAALTDETTAWQRVGSGFHVMHQSLPSANSDCLTSYRWA